jgi:hypothetical protein
VNGRQVHVLGRRHDHHEVAALGFLDHHRLGDQPSGDVRGLGHLLRGEDLAVL